LNDIWVDSFPPAQNQFFLNLNCDDYSDTVAVRLADAGNPDCVSETSYIVNCPDTSTCAINDLNAVITCTADLAVFQITFIPQNAAGHGFDVWINQTYYGFYQYSNFNSPQMLSLTVTNDGEPTYEVKV